MRHYRLNAGFTAMELIVTVAVLGILLGIAVPSFQDSIDKRRLIDAAEQLYSDLQYARSEAVKQNKEVKVSFNTTAPWCYGLDDDTTTTCDCANAPGNCTIGGNQKVTASEGFGPNLSITPPGYGLTFRPVLTSLTSGHASFIASGVGTIQIITSGMGRIKLCSDDVSGYKPTSGTC